VAWAGLAVVSAPATAAGDHVMTVDDARRAAIREAIRDDDAVRLAALRDEDPPRLSDPRDPDVEIVAGVWFPRLGGEVQLGAGGTVFRIDREIRTDEAEATPLVEVSILDDEGFMSWRFHGFDFSGDVSGRTNRALTFGSLSFAAGDAYEASTDFSSVGFEHVIHRWTAIDPGATTGPGIGRGEARLDFSAIAGLRWIGVEQRITRVGDGVASPGADWLAAYAAARMEFTWAPEGGFIVGRSFRITGEYGLGPGLNAGGGTVWHVRAGGELEFTDSIRGFFGYRLLELNLEDGDWTFDSGLQGLFVGATIQF
jgi:hypothetical protein